MRTSYRSIALALAIAPLALGAAACKGKDDGASASLSGDPIAKVAAPAGKAWADTISETADGGMLMGNPDAPIKLVEYGSLSCPHCAKLAQEGMDALTNDFVSTGRVSYEFRSFAIHPQDVPLTMLVRCGTKDTFFPLVHQIYSNFDAMNAVLEDKAVQERANAAMQGPPATRFTGLSDALGYTDFFAARGIAKDQSAACLNNAASAKSVADFSQKYSEAGISSTPTLVINGRTLDINTWPLLKAELERLGAR